jgi:hypothetical protein
VWGSGLSSHATNCGDDSVSPGHWIRTKRSDRSEMLGSTFALLLEDCSGSEKIWIVKLGPPASRLLSTPLFLCPELHFSLNLAIFSTHS